MQKRPLGSTGDYLSVIGFGGIEVMDEEPAAAADMVSEAIGRGIKASGVPREDIFLMSMLPQWHLGYNMTMANFEDTLRQLQTDYVDLYMYHWPGMFVDQLPMEPAAHPEVNTTARKRRFSLDCVSNSLALCCRGSGVGHRGGA